MNELHQIELNIGHDVKRCIKHVLFLWQKRSPDGSHEDVAKTLKASGYDLLSAMICFQYSQTQSVTFCASCQTTHGLDISDYELLNHILGSMFTHQNFVF